MLDRILAAPVFSSRRALLVHAARIAPAGIACEFGVFQGTSLQTIRDQRPGPVYGFDSWQGLPIEWETGGPDRHLAGHFACAVPDVPGAEMVPGWYEETIPSWKARVAESVALLHVDCDLYSSARTVLFGMDDRIATGAVVVFDELVDFEGRWYPNWRDGEWRALNEWTAECGRVIEPIGRTLHQQAAFIVRS